MTGLRKSDDAYGLQITRHAAGESFEVIERDDGRVEAYSSAYLFAPYAKWSVLERKAIRLARGRVLDVGAGGGRVALYLQGKGHDVVAIDISQGAIETCRSRGVKDARVLPFEKIDDSLGVFDTVVMFGNNFGLFGTPTRAKTLLRRLHKMTSGDARILGETIDPYDTKDREHLDYHKLNKQRGRWPGQLRIRARHRKLKTPWFDYLFVSRKEMEQLTRDTGWHVERFIEPTGYQYVGVLEKD
jgi:SAM-dependent methyltransferase